MNVEIEREDSRARVKARDQPKPDQGIYSHDLMCDVVLVRRFAVEILFALHGCGHGGVELEP